MSFEEEKDWGNTPTSQRMPTINRKPPWPICRKHSKQRKGEQSVPPQNMPC